MDRAEAFKQLGAITEQRQQLEGQLGTILAKEAELYNFLKIPQPGIEKPKRHRISKEKTLDIRRKVMSVMRDLSGHGINPAPLQLIIAKTNQEMPAAEEDEIERQVRALAAMDSAPVKHNGSRGNGSAYEYTGSELPSSPSMPDKPTL